jgi:hypothetical protein
MSVAVPAGCFVCECCGLWYPVTRPISADVEARMHQPNRLPGRCGRCSPHRGDDAETLVRRAEDHVQWYWELYQSAVDAAREMRAEVEQAEVRAGDYRERMIAAFRSRDHGVRQMRRIGDLHAPVRGGCSCGKRPDCETAKIIDSPWVQARLRELERREAHELHERFDVEDLYDGTEIA